MKKLSNVRTAAVMIGLLAMLLPVSLVQAAQSAKSSNEFEINGNTLVSYHGKSKDVTIPAGVTSIGREAFKNCDFIENVTFPEKLNSIGTGAFENCNSLQLLSLPASLQKIAASAFSGCKKLSSVYVGGKTAIEPGVFAGCTGLATVSFSAESPYVCKDGVIYDKQEKTLIAYLAGRPKTSYTMPNTVTKVERYAFWGANLLIDLKMSDKLTDIGGYAFSNCKSLDKTVIPEGVKELDLYSFQDCRALKSVLVPQSVNYIHATAFKGCGNVTIYTPSGSYAQEFGKGTGIKTSTDTAKASISGQNTVTKEVSQNTADPPVSGNQTAADNNMSVFGYPKDTTKGTRMGEGVVKNGTVSVALDGGHIYDGQTVQNDERSHDLSEASENVMERWKEKDTYEIQQGILDSYNGNQNKVLIGSDVNVIGERAFYRNKDLKTVELPKTVTEINDFAFARSGLTSVNIPTSVKKIGYAAFYQANDLEKVLIPETVQEIEKGAFSGTKWLDNWYNTPSSSDFLIVGDGILLAYKGTGNTITIPDGVKTIGSGVFAGNNDLTKITLPKSIQTIAEGAFEQCSRLTAAPLPAGVVHIQDRAFYGCPLKQIILPDTLQSVGLGAFALGGNQNTNTAKAVIFTGKQLPDVNYQDSAASISNQGLLIPVFDGIGSSVVSKGTNLKSGNVFLKEGLGFKGKVYEIDNSIYDYHNKTLKLSERPVVLEIAGNKSENKAGIDIMCSAKDMDVKNITAQMTGNNKAYQLRITDGDKQVQSDMQSALSVRYDGTVPSDLQVLDIKLYDSTGTVAFSQLGSSKVTITMPVSKAMIGSSGVLHVACLNQNKQFEELYVKQTDIGDAMEVTFTASHFSTYSIYMTKK